MFRRVSLAIAFSVFAAGAAADPTSQDPAKVPPGSYMLDKRHASLIMKVPHLGFSRYTMRFMGLEGSFSYDPTAWQTTQVKITVDPKSVDTGDSSFSKTVTGFFDPEKYPTIQFVSTALTADGEGRGQLTGDLTFHGVTKPVTLDVAFNGVGPGILGAGTRMGFSGSGRIKRSEFGINAARMWAGDTVDLLFEVEFVKQ